jgi:hypothetical protein
MSVLAPPPQDELEALIREARERQRRRRVRAASFVAVAAAAGLGVHALVGGGKLANLAQPPADGGRATGPLCRATQLSTVMFFQGSGQTMVGGARITNTSGAACSLPTGTPTVDVSWQGKPLALGERAVPSPSPSTHLARVLAPGAQASVYLQWFDQWFCNTQPQKDTFDPRFELRFGTSLAIAAKATGLPVPNCGKPGGLLTVSRALAEP